MSYRAMIGLLFGAALFVWVAMFTVSMATSGSAVSGFNNVNNRVYADPTREELASLLVSTRSAPEVSDETLRAIHEAISRRAAAGQPQGSSMRHWSCFRWQLFSASAHDPLPDLCC